ncbi:integrase catalytic domain-containing protein [Trichonephila clavipes]|nr:integrase catalytic domain-containing protein [Trichonephila clavipes]
MARRGKCAKLFSDNGKNFVGASNEIKKLLEIVRNPDEKLANYLAAGGIEWKFIPARSPNFGGPCILIAPTRLSAYSSAQICDALIYVCPDDAQFSQEPQDAETTRRYQNFRNDLRKPF